MTRKRIVLAAVGLIGLALLFAVLFRLPLAEAGLKATLAAQGFDTPRLRVVQLDWRRLAVAEFSVGDTPQIRIGSLVADFTPGGLIAGRLDRLAVSDASIRLRTGEKGIVVEGLPLFAGSDTDSGPPELPVGELLLENVRIQAATPFGEVVADLGGRLQPVDGESGISARLSYAVRSQYGAASGRIAGEFTGPDGVAAEMSIADGNLQGPFASARDLAGQLTVTLRRGLLTEATVDLAAGTLSAQADGGETSGLSGTVAITGRYRDDRGQLSVILNEPENAAAISLDGSVDTPLSAPAWDLSGRLEVTERSALWPALDIQPPSSGRATVTFASRGRAPEEWRAADQGLAGMLASLDATAQARLELKQIDHAALGKGLDGRMDVEAEIGNGVLALRWPESGDLRLAELAPGLFDPADLPSEFRPKQIGALTLALQPRDDTSPTIRVRQDGGHYRVEFDGGLSLSATGGIKAAGGMAGSIVLDGDGGAQRFDVASFGLDAALSRTPALRGLAVRMSGTAVGTLQQQTAQFRLQGNLDHIDLHDIEASRLALALPLEFEHDGNTLTLRQSGDGSLSLARLTAGPVAVESDTVLSLRPSREPLASLIPPSAPDGSMTGNFAVQADSKWLALRLRQSGAEPVAIDLSDIHMTVSASTGPGDTAPVDADLSISGLSIPAYDLKASSVAATSVLVPAGKRAELSLTMASVRHDLDTPLFVPIRLSANATRQGQSVTFVTSAFDGQNVERLSLKGDYDLTAQGGQVAVHLPALVFAPNALQPKALFPPLGDLTDVSGSLTGDLRVALSPDGLDGGGTLRAEGLGFTLGGLRVSGIGTTLQLTKLSPLTSAANQELKIATIDSVTTVNDIDVRYRLGGGGADETVPRLFVERFAAKLFGGAVSGTDVVADPADGRLDGTLTVQSLSLEQIMALIGAEGVTGTGALSGTIPVSVDGGRLRVQGGALASDGEGVLHIPSDQVAQIIGTGNKDLALVARVLENFRYESLSMRIDKQAEGDGQVRLSMLGHNPAVLDGHPFQFNVNLSSNVDELLVALAQAYGQATGLMNRALENIR